MIINEKDLIKHIYNKSNIDTNIIKNVLDLELDYLREIRVATYRKPNLIQDTVNEILMLYKKYKDRKVSVK